MAMYSGPQYMAAGCGLPMIMLDMTRRSAGHCSMGPSGVDAQSMERANRMCSGSSGVMAMRVQSNEARTLVKVAPSAGGRAVGVATADSVTSGGSEWAPARGPRRARHRRSTRCGL